MCKMLARTVLDSCLSELKTMALTAGDAPARKVEDLSERLPPFRSFDRKIHVGPRWLSHSRAYKWHSEWLCSTHQRVISYWTNGWYCSGNCLIWIFNRTSRLQRTLKHWETHRAFQLRPFTITCPHQSGLVANLLTLTHNILSASDRPHDNISWLDRNRVRTWLLASVVSQ